MSTVEETTTEVIQTTGKPLPIECAANERLKLPPGRGKFDVVKVKCGENLGRKLDW